MNNEKVITNKSIIDFINSLDYPECMCLSKFRDLYDGKILLLVYKELMKNFNSEYCLNQLGDNFTILYERLSLILRNTYKLDEIYKISDRDEFVKNLACYMIRLFNPFNSDLIYSQMSTRTDFVDKTENKIKPKLKYKLDVLRGIPNVSTLEDFKFIKFLRPTSAHWDDRIKFSKNFSKPLKINFNLLESVKKDNPKPIKPDLVEWINEQGFKIQNISELGNKFEDGLLLANLINRLESKNVIKTVTPMKNSHKLINIKKSLNYLKTIDKINKLYLNDPELIMNGDTETIIGLLESIQKFYCIPRYIPIYTIKENTLPIKYINDGECIIDNEKTIDNSDERQLESRKRYNVSLKNINKNIKAMITSQPLRATLSDKLNKSVSYIYSNPDNSIHSYDNYILKDDKDSIEGWLSSIGVDNHIVNRLNFKSGNILKDFKDGLLYARIINLILDREEICISKSDSKASSLANLRKLLNYLRQNNRFSICYHFCEDQLYEAKSEFIYKFIKHLKKLFKNKTKNNKSHTMRFITKTTKHNINRHTISSN